MNRVEMTCGRCGAVGVPGRLVHLALVEGGRELKVDAPCPRCWDWMQVFVPADARDALLGIGARTSPAPPSSRMTTDDLDDLVHALDAPDFVERLGARLGHQVVHTPDAPAH